MQRRRRGDVDVVVEIWSGQDCGRCNGSQLVSDTAGEGEGYCRRRGLSNIIVEM